jgi:hypothetical protein
VLGEYKGSQAREVVMTLEEYEHVREQLEAAAEAEYEGGSQDVVKDKDSAEPDYVREGQRGYASVGEDD